MLAVALLVVPAVARSEDVFKWRDARGRLHYSNDQARVPEGARPVTRRIGEIGGTPVGEVARPVESERPAAPPALRVAPWTATSSCVDGLGLFALPGRSVDLDRRSWFDVDRACGRQWDVESWLRGATTVLELRKIGL